MLIYRLKIKISRFLVRVTPLTWLIWGIFAADLLAPGLWVYGLVIAEVDLTEVAEDVRQAYAGND